LTRFSDALNEQIASEFAASQQYVAVAVHYDAQTLPQLAAHFYRQAVEERNHAMMMVQYLLDADAPVVTPAVAAPRTNFADEHEHVGEHFLGWFLDEQREEVASMNALLAIIDRAGTDNMLLVEAYLGRSGGVTANEPSSPSPPAAGGAL
jgi:ferritin